MTIENPNEMTFEGLKQFLIRIGFDQPAKICNSLAFHHVGTETIIVLTIPEDGRTVRDADLLSVLVRLEAQGLADNTVLDQFRRGVLPLAS